MKLEKFLIIGKTNSTLSARIAHRRPALESHEIAINLVMDIPKELFDRPQLTAKLDITKDNVQQIDIKTDFINNLKALSANNLGVELIVEEK